MKKVSGEKMLPLFSVCGTVYCCIIRNMVVFTGKLQESRRHLEAATVLMDYADVRVNICIYEVVLFIRIIFCLFPSTCNVSPKTSFA